MKKALILTFIQQIKCQKVKTEMSQKLEKMDFVCVGIRLLIHFRRSSNVSKVRLMTEKTVNFWQRSPKKEIELCVENLIFEPGNYRLLICD